ncbi:hypothetical protein [Fusobacterium polymorphum]|jgi:hydrolase (metallo-beta-lactamase superfamily)|uniref:ComEC/Rec2 family competence protein n=1 Tax=Fusobacterium nucleatum subsp. polymorphum TaxID=76857 RepID=UPI00300BB400
MAIIHFLNVKNGDCTLIQHSSGRNTLIDISNGNDVKNFSESALESLSPKGNFKQKLHPIDPIKYLQDLEINEIFRFILTHPDMDHMDGIKRLFNSFKIINFWDTKNNKVIENFGNNGSYKKEDWDFYQNLRCLNSNLNSKYTILHLLSGSKNRFFNKDYNGQGDGDGLYILSPTKDLIREANHTKDYNDCSYVILYNKNNKKIIFAGDSGKKTWDHILCEYKELVSNIDILIAPHHGRKSGGNDEYLDILKPKLTLFGNANSEHLDYSSWNNRNLQFITNNQAGSIILDTNVKDGIGIFITNENFAKNFTENPLYNKKYNAWYIRTI